MSPSPKKKKERKSAAAAVQRDDTRDGRVLFRRRTRDLSLSFFLFEDERESNVSVVAIGKKPQKKNEFPGEKKREKKIILKTTIKMHLTIFHQFAQKKILCVVRPKGMTMRLATLTTTLFGSIRGTTTTTATTTTTSVRRGAMMTEHHQQQQQSSSSSNVIAKTLRGGGVLVRAQQTNDECVGERVAARASTSATKGDDDDDDDDEKEKERSGREKAKTKGPTPAPKHTRAYGTPMTGYQLEHGQRLMAEDSPFASLNLKEAMKVGAAKGVRCRQHVNPLSQKFCKPSETPSWDVIFKDISKPLTIDVGCGGGRFPLAMAKRFRERNFLGVDVREALVERGEKWGEFAEVSENVAFAAGNCTVSLKPWLEDYNENNKDNKRGKVELVCVQFPDPHFKRKHWKRRVVQKEMVEALASGLEEGARVFLQSDVKEVAEDMRDKFEKFGNGKFVVDDSLHVRGEHEAIFEADAPDPSDWEGEEHEGFIPTWYQKGWLKENPLGVPTEREVQTINEGQPCFRVMLCVK